MAIKIVKKARVTAPEPARITKHKPVRDYPVLDGMYRSVRDTAPMAIVPWWLIASYLYYVHDLSLVSDSLYDEMAQDMLDDWGSIEHPHKHLITEEDLRAGSLYRLSAGEYPSTTRGAAGHLVKGEWKISIDEKRSIDR